MFGDVTSANIVGYSTQEAGGDGFVAITPVFDSVSTANQIKLSEFKFEPARGDNIQMFDGDGNVVKQITWLKHSAKDGGQYYWQLEDFTNPDDPQTSEIVDFTFERGKSFWLQFDSAIDFTQSGAVNANEAVYNVGLGFACVGNPRPTELKLSELEFSDKARGDNVQIFDGDGNVVKQITWLKHSAKDGGQYYWQLEDFTNPDDPQTSEISDYTFPAGSAFWIQCEEEGTVTIPALKL